MIKQLYYFLLILFMHQNLTAQTYVQLAIDEKGDAAQALSPDLKAISYASDEQTDSLWMVFEFYSPVRKMEFNVKIGLDSNDNPSDGGNWAGANQSMSLDLLVDIFHNPGFNHLSGNVYDGSDSFISSNVFLRFLDSHILLVNLRLSEFKKSQQNLNVLAGCGIILGNINDEIPDNGFLTIRSNNSSLHESEMSPHVSLYPQPAKDFVMIHSDPKLGMVKQVRILNMQGQVLEEKEVLESDGKLDVSRLASGKYILIITYEYFGSRVVSMLK